MSSAGYDAAVSGREFLDELQEGIWVADGHGAIVYANSALARILGYETPQVLIGRLWSDFLPRGEVSRFAAARPQDNVRRLADSAVLGRDNQPIPAGVAVVRRETGKSAWYIGSVLPNYRAASGMSDTTARQILENAVDGVCVVEAGRIQYANRRLEELTGYASPQLTRLTIDRLVAPYNRQAVVQSLTEPREPVQLEVRLLRRTGQEVDCELRVAPSESGGRGVLLCFFRDVSQLRRAERAQTDFIAMVSHELRTPLASLKEAIALLFETSAGTLQDRQRRYLAIAREEMDRLNRMVDNLIEASRMEAGKVSLRLEAQPLDRLISKSLDSLALLVAKRSLRVEKQLPTGLPRVYVDHDRTLQVLNNLLDNAIKYSPTGSRVEITAHRVDADASVLNESGVIPGADYVQVNITDSGPGIPAEFLERVFGKFERVDPHGPGIGLGLAIVRWIVEMHHGKVWARSTLGEGTTFSFILPAKENNE